MPYKEVTDRKLTMKENIAEINGELNVLRDALSVLKKELMNMEIVDSEPEPRVECFDDALNSIHFRISHLNDEVGYILRQID